MEIDESNPSSSLAQTFGMEQTLTAPLNNTIDFLVDPVVLIVD
jgi:hypothetical protein